MRHDQYLVLVAAVKLELSIQLADHVYVNADLKYVPLLLPIISNKSSSSSGRTSGSGSDRSSSSCCGCYCQCGITVRVVEDLLQLSLWAHTYTPT